MQDEQQVPQQETTDMLQYVAQSARFLKRTYWMILVAIVLGVALFGLRVQQSYNPTYSCRAVLSVHVDNVSVTDIISSSSTSIDAKTTQQIVNTFSTIINADAMHERILSVLRMNNIPGSITPAVIADSNLFTITAKASTPEDAYKILSAVLECYPDMAFMVIGAARIELIEEPEMPTEPEEKPGLAKPMITGGLLFGVIMLVILCLIGQTQHCVTTTADMRAISNLPCIVHVPKIEPKRRGKAPFVLNLQNKNIPPAYEEAIRVMRSRILDSVKEKSVKKIMVTSTLPSEGKSTIAANLAMNLSASGLRVILVDADLRTQELGEFFDVQEKGHGLVDLLKDDTLNPVDCLTTLPDTDLRLICGTAIPRPISLLRRKNVQSVLEKLEEEADLIVIDTPPIGLLADAATFAQCADCAVYVVRTELVPPDRVADGLQMVQDSGIELLGYVLNGVTAHSGRTYGYGYSYRYSYSSRYYRRSGSYGNYGGGYGRSNYSGYSRKYGTYGNKLDDSYGNYGNYGNYGSYGGYGSGYGSYGSGYGSGYGDYGSYGNYSNYGNYGKYAKYGKTGEHKPDAKAEAPEEKSLRKKFLRKSEMQDEAQITNEILETLESTAQNRGKNLRETKSGNAHKSYKAKKK